MMFFVFCFQALVIFLSKFLPIRYHIETNGFLTCIVLLLLPIKYRPLLWIIVLAHVVQGKLCTGEVIYIQGAIKNIQ